MDLWLLHLTQDLQLLHLAQDPWLLHLGTGLLLLHLVLDQPSPPHMLFFQFPTASLIHALHLASRFLCNYH